MYKKNPTNAEQNHPLQPVLASAKVREADTMYGPLPASLIHVS